MGKLEEVQKAAEESQRKLGKAFDSLSNTALRVKYERDALLAACKVALKFTEADWDSPSMDDVLEALRNAIAFAEEKI